MTYNEWRDELKNNLLSVSEAERRRVLDYYAEAYADRREAGFSEREIIADFGAPYDAAQRILNDSDDDTYVEPPKAPRDSDTRRGYHEARHEARRESRRDGRADDYREARPYVDDTKTKNREDFKWLYVLLCIVFAIPIFVVVMTMTGVTIGMCAAPFGVIGAGMAQIIAGIGETFSNLSGGIEDIGFGLIQIGVGIALIPLFIWLVKLMWKLFRMFFRWVKRLLCGREDE